MTQNNEPKTYIRKPEVLKAVQIDAQWAEVLKEQGFVNPTIGDYFIDNVESQFSIMQKDAFEKMFVEVQVVENAQLES